MNPPPKTWEQSSRNPPTSSTAGPPVPPRSGRGATRPSFGMPGHSLASPYSSYSPYSYGSYGSGYGASRFGYGGFGGAYGGGYGGAYSSGYGASGYEDRNEFVQLAEDNVRPAFESVESIVQAFGSVSMMLESTFFAVHSSFRAVLGVAEQFGRMKTQFSQIFSAFAAVRALRWLLQKVQFILGIRKENPELVWNEVTSGSASVQPLAETDVKKSVNWPILMYLTLVFSAPYVIWKLIRSMTSDSGAETDQTSWMRGEGEHFVATASYDFAGRNDEEVSFSTGQELILAPRHRQPRVRGWLLGSADGKTSGLIPANYIKIIGRKNGGGTRQPPPDIVNSAV